MCSERMRPPGTSARSSSTVSTPSCARRQPSVQPVSPAPTIKTRDISAARLANARRRSQTLASQPIMAQSAPPSPLDLYPPDAPPPPHDRGRLIWRLRESKALAAGRRAMLAACRATYRLPARFVSLPIREELGFMLNARGLTGCGAEVGVRDGWFSEMLLDRWRGAHLISVDPWREFTADE